MDPWAQRRIYGILDLGYVAAGEELTMARRLMAGGIEVLQLRAKKAALDDVVKLARALWPITRDAGVPLLINDHPAAVEFGDGIHVGQEDLSVAEARRLIGPGKIVGKSTHSVAQAVAAAEEGADYLGFGPLFATPTKPEYAPIGLEEIRRVHEAVPIPIFCIGGIKLANLDEVLAAGARRVVIVSGFLSAVDPAATVRAARERVLSFAAKPA